MIPSLVFNSGCFLLEGPVFDKENEHLYFVSILSCLVYFYDPNTNQILSVKLDSPVGCVYILGPKKVLAASKNGFYEINFNTLQKQLIFKIEIDSTVRFNDGIKDPKGRFIVGTIGYPEVKENIAKVYSYYKGKYKTIIENTTISNGLAFSLDNKFLYFIDTPTKKVAKYSYNVENGEISFDSNVIEFKGESSPDGMCIDKNSMLWIAEWGGGCVSKWNPATGQKIAEIKLPCTNVTSCCLDNNSNLYITAAKSDSQKEIYDGGLFYIELDKI